MRGSCDEHSQRRNYGTGKLNGKTEYLHRLAYCNAHGLDISKLKGVVMHLCDNPRCVNSDHLKLGTHLDNTQDMIAKGRQVNLAGDEAPRSLLTSTDVVDIRQRYVPYCRINGSRALGREYGVSNTTIRDALKRRTWRTSSEAH